MQSQKQKDDIQFVEPDINKNIDYVAMWYFKAAQLIQGTKIMTAFVSTNSITQGEQVCAIWKPLTQKYNVHITFAYRTFRWDNEATDKAHVHCVIIGFTTTSGIVNRKLYSANGPQLVNNINGYLIAAPNIFIESRKHPLSNIPEMIKGSSPVDGGNLTVTNQDYMKIIQKDAIAKKYIKPFLGAKEYLHNTKRWCVWLVGAEPVDINKSVFIMNRIAAVREFRLKSKKATTNKYANYATRFMEIRQPMTNYILVPRHSSENRKYIPFGFMNKETICGDANNMIPNATLYHFGVLESNVHMAWVKTICGRIKSDYRYSNDIVYNNFPWPESTETQIQKIEQTAQGILDARALYPDSSLADLYNPVTMPMELMNAHRANDKAVWEAYGKAWDITSESGCVAYLMKLYQELVAKN